MGTTNAAILDPLDPLRRPLLLMPSGRDRLACDAMVQGTTRAPHLTLLRMARYNDPSLS